jgi:uncharacterized membrane protein YtjA (UPF0391 family)
MIGLSATFLIIAIIAGFLGLTGIAGSAVKVFWTIFFTGLILAFAFAKIGRRTPPM